MSHKYFNPFSSYDIQVKMICPYCKSYKISTYLSGYMWCPYECKKLFYSSEAKIDPKVKKFINEIKKINKQMIKYYKEEDQQLKKRSK